MVNSRCCEQGKRQQPQQAYKDFDRSEVVELVLLSETYEARPTKKAPDGAFLLW